MTSTDLETLGFDEWWLLGQEGQPMYPTSASELLAAAPSSPGVYVLRESSGENFGRWRGESDLVYIGCAMTPRGLRGRFRDYVCAFPVGTAGRVMDSGFGSDFRYELAWVQRPSSVKARA